ncbi:tRNA(Ile)-lysidine synthase [Smittium culicis]|uniref:tRNA(Ile)-lysidine synthetase n=1 Tax=Smittium culicis TaxID=133412 RepID=A0A1R1YLS5_9FUNG|nr:tRNA(Ile)-lysidine synthase [Smittium culicis]
MLSKFNKIIRRYDSRDLKYAIAVSGGVDSMALTYLAKKSPISDRFSVIVINHNLRPDSQVEISNTLSNLKNIGIKPHLFEISWKPHFSHTLSQNIPIQNSTKNKIVHFSNHEMPAPGPKLEEIARLERYAIISKYCHDNNISRVLTGHHKNDLAETFLMRLSRQSGILGLSPMETLSKFPISASNLLIFRPLLLHFEKNDLIKICSENGIKWVQDSSNSSLVFQRNNVRSTIRTLDSKYRSHPFSLPNILNLYQSIQSHSKNAKSLVDYKLSLVSKINPSNGSHCWDPSQTRSEFFSTSSRSLLLMCISKTLKLVSNSQHSPKLASITKFATFLENPDNFSSSICYHNVILRKPSRKNNFFEFSKQEPAISTLLNLKFTNIPLHNSFTYNNQFTISFSSQNANATNTPRYYYSVFSLASFLNLFHYCHNHHDNKNHPNTLTHLPSSYPLPLTNKSALTTYFHSQFIPFLNNNYLVTTLPHNNAHLLSLPVIAIHNSILPSSLAFLHVHSVTDPCLQSFDFTLSVINLESR